MMRAGDLAQEWLERRLALERRTFAAEAGVPTRLLHLWESGWRETQAVRACIEAVRGGKHLIVMHGVPGTGKSAAAAAALLAPALELPGGPRFVGKWIGADEYCQAYFHHLAEVARQTMLLVIDDLGAEAGDDHWRLERLISKRYDSEAAVTVATTNLTGEQFARAYGPRVSSRLKHVGVTIRCTELVRPGEVSGAASAPAPSAGGRP